MFHSLQHLLLSPKPICIYKSQRSATLISYSWFYTKLRIRPLPPFLPNRRTGGGSSSSRHTIQIFCDQHQPVLNYYFLCRQDLTDAETTTLHHSQRTGSRMGSERHQQLTLPVRNFKLNVWTRPHIPAVVSALYRHLLLTIKL